MQHSLSWKANQVNNLILRAKSFRLSRSSTFTVSNQKKRLRFSHRSRCCVCHTSSNFLLLALRDACVNVCILFRLAVKVFVISAGKKNDEKENITLAMPQTELAIRFLQSYYIPDLQSCSVFPAFQGHF